MHSPWREFPLRPLLPIILIANITLKNLSAWIPSFTDSGWLGRVDQRANTRRTGQAIKMMIKPIPMPEQKHKTINHPRKVRKLDLNYKLANRKYRIDIQVFLPASDAGGRFFHLLVYCSGCSIKLSVNIFVSVFLTTNIKVHRPINQRMLFELWHCQRSRAMLERNTYIYAR